MDYCICETHKFNYMHEYKKAYTSPSGNGIYKDQNHSSISHQGFEDSLQSQAVF